MTRPSGLSGAGAIGLGKVSVAELGVGTIGLNEAAAAELEAGASGGGERVEVAPCDLSLPTAPLDGTAASFACFGGIGIPFAVGISFAFGSSFA